jgi:two-component system KDP operon response regulator KdpE
MSESSEPARILVIDDEQQIRRFLRISLRSQGYQVLEADRGQQGLELAAARNPDLVVLDLGLPDMDGKDVLRDLRAWTSVPVIVLSVRASEAEKVCALDRGATDYVTKPFGMQEFLARLRNQLRLRLVVSAEQPGIYDDGLLRIDLAKRSIVLDEEPVHLTRKEFAILRMLVAHPDRVITQTQLLREIWGETHLNDTHYLRNFIGSLRQKLGDAPSDPRYIFTETGVGYRFVDHRGEDPGRSTDV